MSRQTPAAGETPLPLKCGGCDRAWPNRCRCPHPRTCRTCGTPLEKPYATSAGYCSLDCFLRKTPRG